MRAKVLFLTLFLVIGLGLPAVSAQKTPLDESYYRLLLTVFVQSGDLKRAFYVAQKGVERFPESPYWHRWLAQVSMWTGKTEVAMREYGDLWRLSGRATYLEKYLHAAVSLNRFDIAAPILAKKVLSGKISLLKDMVYAYQNAGFPEKALEVIDKLLKRRDYPEALILGAYVAESIGEVEKAIAYLKRLSKIRKLKPNELLFLSHLYFVSKKFDKALDVLSSHTIGVTADKIEYWKTLSNLAWALNKWDVAASASEKLLLQGKARIEDYERLALFYRETRPEVAERLYRDAYLKFKKTYFFYNYADIALRSRHFQGLYRSIQSLSSSERASLEKKPDFWLILADVYQGIGKKKEALFAYKKALSLSPHDAGLKAAIIYALMDLDENRELDRMIGEIELKGNVPQTLIPALAAAYAYLQRSEKATRYFEILLSRHPEDPEVLSAFADVLDTLEAEKARAYILRKKAWEKVKRDPEKDYRLYLRLALHVLPPAKIIRLFENSKGKLPINELREIEISWYLSRDELEKASWLARDAKVSPWIHLSMALSCYDRDAMRNYLYAYWIRLPIRDRVNAAMESGEIPLAQELAFRGLEENPRDYLLYYQMRDISEETADKAKIKLWSEHRYPLSLLGTRGWVIKRLSKGLFTKVSFKGLSVSSLDKDELHREPSKDTGFEFGIGRKTERTKSFFSLGYRDALESFLTFYGGLKRDIGTGFTLGIEGGFNQKAMESVYMEIGGVRDYAMVSGMWQFLPSTSFLVTYTKDIFRSQDRAYEGRGDIFSLEVSRAMRSGYPSIAIRSFFTYGDYSEENRARGSIAQLSPTGLPDLLPNDYWEVGAGVDMGLENRENFTRVWRPFASVSGAYNNSYGLTMDMAVGIGGSLFLKDQLSISFGYTRGAFGTEDNIFRLCTIYKRLF